MSYKFLILNRLLDGWAFWDVSRNWLSSHGRSFYRGMVLKSLIALALALTSACGSSSSQAQSEKTPSPAESLSSVEILQRSDSLRLSIRLDPETVDIGQTPAVVIRLENVGSTDLYVNPHLVTGGYLPDLEEPVRCVTNADYAIRFLTAQRLRSGVTRRRVGTADCTQRSDGRRTIHAQRPARNASNRRALHELSGLSSRSLRHNPHRHSCLGRAGRCTDCAAHDSSVAAANGERIDCARPERRRKR